MRASSSSHLLDGGIGSFGFAVLAIFQIAFSVLCEKTLVFLVLVFTAVCGFSVFKHLVFGFCQKY